MKKLVRNLLIDLIALWLASKFLPGLVIDGGMRSLLIGAATFMMINFTVVPILRLMFLPLNLLTFGFFTWVVNVLALYILTTVLPQLSLIPYDFPGASLGLVIIPPLYLNVLQVAILVSLLISLISNLIKWLIK